MGRKLGMCRRDRIHLNSISVPQDNCNRLRRAVHKGPQYLVVTLDKIPAWVEWAPDKRLHNRLNNIFVSQSNQNRFCTLLCKFQPFPAVLLGKTLASRRQVLGSSGRNPRSSILLCLHSRNRFRNLLYLFHSNLAMVSGSFPVLVELFNVSNLSLGIIMKIIGLELALTNWCLTCNATSVPAAFLDTTTTAVTFAF